MTAMSSPLDERAAGARRFVDRVSIVTGAGQGIGAATARRLGAEGAIVVVADMSEAGASRTRDTLENHGVETMVFLGDLSEWDTCHRLMNETLERFGRIDVLVNNVGGPYRSQYMWEFTEEQMYQDMRRNFWPTMFCMHAALAHMVAVESGAVVNVASSAVRGILRAPYAAAKGGVIALTTSVGLEVAAKGVRVNCVAPHTTAVMDRLVPRNTEPRNLTPEQEALQQARQARFMGEGPYAGIDFTPMKRQGGPEEQASAIAFLASDDASFMTGQVLWVGT